MVGKLEANAKVSSIATQMISAEAGYELLFSASQLLGGCVRMRKKLAKHPCSRVSRRLQVCQRRRRHLPENIRASPVFFLDAEERQGQVMMKGFSPPPLSLPS